MLCKCKCKRGCRSPRGKRRAGFFLCLGLDKSIERQHAPPSAEQSKAGRLVALIDRSTNRLTPFTRSQMPIHPNRYGSHRWRVVVCLFFIKCPNTPKPTPQQSIHSIDRALLP